MHRPPLFPLAAALLCGCPPQPEPEPEPVDTVTCDEPLDGLDWGNPMAADAEPGIEQELAEHDLTSLTESIDLTGLTPLHRGYFAYALQIAPEQLGDSLDRDDTLALGVLGEVVLGSMLLGEADPSGVEFFFFRRGLQRYATCSTGLPLTLDDFKTVFGDYEEIAGEVVDSAAKCVDRRLRADYEGGVFVAETLVDDQVRESEILLTDQRDDDAFVFAVYGEDGRLTDRSLFPTIDGGEHLIAAAPYSCMTCHLDPEASEGAWGFDVLLPEGTGPCAEP